MTQPTVLIFDVNETLLDLDSLKPHFARIFGDERVLREWFAQVILYSQALTLAGDYAAFGTLGGAVLGMIGEIRGVTITDDDRAAIKQAVASMPAHPEVASALGRLREASFRMVTLTNNPHETCVKQLKAAGLSEYFERAFSIDDGVKRYKPAPETYAAVADALKVRLSDCCMIACHTWDTLGAVAAGMQAALILRPGNAALGVGPQPEFVVTDLEALATKLISRRPTTRA